MPAKPRRTLGLTEELQTPFLQGAWGERGCPTPHHCSTICLVGNTMNHGEGAGGGFGRWVGKGESFVDQGHILLGNPSLGEPPWGRSSAQGA